MYRKGWLAGIGLALAVFIMPGRSAAQDQAVTSAGAASQTPHAAPAMVPANLTVAAANGDKSLPAPKPDKAEAQSAAKSQSQGESTVINDPTNQTGAAAANETGSLPAAAVPEKIEVTFKEPTSDILTRKAMEKLDVMVDSLEFANADLQNVIRIIGEKLNINFIFDAQDIDGKVTLRLRNIRLRDALDSILTSRKLAIIADKSGIFRIVPQEQVGRKTVETKTEVVQLNWISSKDVVKTLKPFLSDDVGKMEFNEESNTLIITDVPPQIEVIKGLLKQIDTAERQVLIEARLVDINVGAARQLGTNWSASKLNKKWQNGTPVITGINDDGTPKTDLATLPYKDTLGVVNNLLEGISVKGGQGTLALGETVGIFGSDYNINAVFTALENRNVVEILANPRVTTLNNVPAQISIIEKIPYTQAVSGPSQGTLTQEVEFEKAGVDIKVTPIITPNGFIRMKIEMKQMINRGRIGTDLLSPPQIDERNADTNVIVKDNNTVVLGGLRQVRKNEGIDGVPWLHRVPFFGWLFKNKNYDQSKTELVLMMTPRIIGETAHMDKREKALYKKIDADWHLPDYFFDDTKSADDNAKFKK